LKFKLLLYLILVIIKSKALKNFLFKTFFLGFCLMLGFASCRHTSSVSRSMDAINDRKAEKAKETVAAYDKAVDRHMSIQSKKTQRRMKRDQKKAKKWAKKHTLNPQPCPATKTQ
jgi:hypothetical protein